MLPPGQRPVDGFPRFGAQLHLPPPAVPADPVLEIGGAVAESLSLPVAELARLPRRELLADFHCVAGWSATNLRWEGVAFDSVYRTIIEPSVRPGASVTHLAFAGLDGYRAVVTLEDALAEDVLIADLLGGRPLDGDHGAPARLVSPSQYGFVSVKHLCRIEVHTSAPAEDYGDLSLLVRLTLRGPFRPHPRARVWREERHRFLPHRLVRPIYRLVTPPIRSLSARGSSQGRETRRDAGA